MADISIKDYLEKQNKQERLNIPVQDGGSDAYGKNDRFFNRKDF